MQRMKINLIVKKHCLKNENVYLTKSILTYVIYIVLNVSVHT